MVKDTEAKEAQESKVPLHIPSFSSILSRIQENTSKFLPSSLQLTIVEVSSILTYVSYNPSTLEVTIS